MTDEILAHIHGANAYIQQGQLDPAASLLDAVLRTTEESRVSWHRQRLGAIAGMLKGPRYRGSRRAVDLLQRLDAFEIGEGKLSP